MILNMIYQFMHTVEKKKILATKHLLYLITKMLQRYWKNFGESIANEKLKEHCQVFNKARYSTDELNFNKNDKLIKFHCHIIDEFRGYTHNSYSKSSQKKSGSFLLSNRLRSGPKLGISWKVAQSFHKR